MKSRHNLIFGFLALFFLCSCSKDEFNQTPFDPSEIGFNNSPIVPTPYICKQYTKVIDLDSIVNLWQTQDYAHVNLDACECDTVNILFLNENPQYIYLGWSRFFPEVDTNENLTNSASSIVEDAGLFVYMIDTASFFTANYSFFVSVQFNSCSLDE